MYQQKETKYNLIEFLLFLIILYTVMPIVARLISSTLTTYAYLLILLITFALIMFKRNEKSFNECMLLLLPFLAWKALQLLLATEMVLWGYSILLDCIFLMAGYYVNNFCKQEKIRIGVKILVCVSIITTVTTIVGCAMYPEASRILASVDSKDVESSLYDWRNIGGYSFVYLMVLLHPLLILAYKRRKIKLSKALIGTVLIFVLAIFSEYTTALLLVLITSILYFSGKTFKISNLIFLLILAILAVTVFSEFFSIFLNNLADKVNSENIAYRLRALAGGRTGIENSEDNRIGLYENSFKTFLNNPLIGTCLNGGGGIGGHSFILDFMAQYGIVGLIVMVLMYITIYKYFFAPYKKKKEVGYILWVFIQAIILSTINTGAWLSVLTFFTPLILKFLYADEEE